VAKRRQPLPGRRERASIALVMVLMIGVLFILLPIYWLMVASTKSTQTLFGNNAFVPTTVGNILPNLRTLFSTDSGAYGRWYVNSAIYATVTAALTTYLCTVTGMAIGKFAFRGRRALMAVVLGSLMIPTTVLIVPLFVLEHDLRLTNTYQGVILPLIVFPFGVYFMSVYSRSAVHGTILEAGQVDGCGLLRLVHRIGIPLLRPGMVTLFLIAFIGTWNNYFLPLVLLGSTNKFPLTVGLDIWLSTINEPAAAGRTLFMQVITGSFLSILPMLILFPLVQKYIVRGLSSGAVAGE
jgi:multiple sugar transport system permease protein